MNDFLGHDNTVFALDISADSSILVSGSSDEALKLWDLSSWPPKKLFSIEEVHDLGNICLISKDISFHLWNLGT